MSRAAATDVSVSPAGDVCQEYSRDGSRPGRLDTSGEVLDDLSRNPRGYGSSPSAPSDGSRRYHGDATDVRHALESMTLDEGAAAYSRLWDAIFDPSDATPEEVDEYLRSQGVDPDAAVVPKRGPA